MPSVVPQSVPIASYMASFPPAYPSVPTSLDASIDSWLTLEGGPHAAENALEMVFSGELLAPSNQVQHTSGKWDNFAVDQQAQHSIATTAFSATSASMPAPLNFSTPSANNGPADNGFNKLYPFGLQFEDLWKASPPSNTCTFETAGMHTSAGESSKESHQVEASLMSNLPVSMTAKSTEDLVERHSTTAFAGTSRGLPSATSPPTISSHTSAARDSDMDTISPRPRPKRKVVHRGLTTDTWLNTMQASEEGNIDLPRPDITSPEQIIGELAVETSVVCCHLTNAFLGWDISNISVSC